METEGRTRRSWHAAAALEGGEKRIKLIMSSHANLTTDESRKSSRLNRSAKHPLDRLYSQLAYQPMLEVLRIFVNGSRRSLITGGGLILQ
jgi:transcriptional regulator of acetoin/glycerol metabolism